MSNDWNLSFWNTLSKSTIAKTHNIENPTQNHQKNSNMSRVRAFISPSKYWRARYTRVCPSDKGGGPREAVKPEESPVRIVVPVVKHSLWCRDVAFLHFYCLSYIFRAVRNMGRIPRKAAINNAPLIDCRNLFEWKTDRITLFLLLAKESLPMLRCYLHCS